MKPGSGKNRRHMRDDVIVLASWESIAFVKRRKLFCILLFYHAEAAKLALGTIKVTMMIGVASDEAIAADVIVNFYSFQHMDREGQPSNPGFAGLLVIQIDLRRGRVMRPGLCPQI